MAVIIIALSPMAASTQPTPEFGIDAALCAPFVSNLSAASDGRALVWEVAIRGRRNLYLSTDRGTHMRKVTSYDADDGQELDSVSFLPGDHAMIYMRGGSGSDTGGDNVNPRSLSEPPRRTIFLVDMERGRTLRIGEGTYPRISPRGDVVAWVNRDELYTASLRRLSSGYRIGRPQIPFHIRGAVGIPMWSPDGSKIAFANDRDDHRFIVVYDIRSKMLAYAAPDFAIDDYPTWSPDGTRLAFIRQPGNREDESSYSAPSHEPWSIWVVDARTMQAHAVWRAARGIGSQFYESDNSDQLWWLRPDHLVFTWEGDGWRHLYAVPARGGAARLLTRGKFEIETVSHALDGRSLVYSSNQDDLNARHIWRVGLEGQQRPVGRSVANQWSPVATAAGFADIEAGWRVPTAVVTHPLGAPARMQAVPIPSQFAGDRFVKPLLVQFTAPDGLHLFGQLFLPRDGQRRHRALIFTHGGSERQMLLGFHYMDVYTDLYELNQYFANHGFVVLSINYRSGIMYGHDFREAKNVGARGASEYQDVLAGARFLQRRADVDLDKIALYGLSYGGYLTALGLARDSATFKTGLDFAGVHNWVSYYDSYAHKKLGTSEQRRVAYEASPEASLASWSSPVFLSQGDDDRNVPFSQGNDLTTRLRDQGVDVQTLVFPNENHENLLYRDVLRLYSAASTFLFARMPR
ncbi:MAG: S9 family peptidase [Candidatus Eremiobacteraeota bacterium]|nr:S9 family peptidase [Candidatus Eremiobacteraeota bacterium]MBC5808730.1 S9 family peptidase [Candidatus Eremiobacteraeota bacterium]